MKGWFIAIAMAGVVIAGMFIMEAVGGKDPMNSHGMGPGWECDMTRGGATTCAKDVRVPPARK